MIHYFGAKISENMSKTPEGYLICRNVPIARTGEQIYLARELGLDGVDPEAQVMVHRDEEEVFSPEAMASFEGKDLTDGHPPVGLEPSNFASYSKGHIQNVRRDGETLVADLIIKDPTLLSEVENKVKREVSCGYNCDYEAAGDGYRQTHIRGNHVAVVPRGRAGHEIAIQDSAVEARKGAHEMSATRELLKFFGIAAKDASPEQISDMAEDAAKVLEAGPTQKVPDAEPTDTAPKDADIPKGDDLGTKLDKILERIETIEKKVNGHGGPEKDEEPTGEEAIDAVLTELSGEDGCGKDGESEVLEEKEEVKAPDKETAAAILRMLRPVVAGIEDKAAQKQVTDAILESVRSGSVIKDIQGAVTATAKKAHDEAAKTGFDKVCQAQSSAYSARNPHTIKKED